MNNKQLNTLSFPLLFLTVFASYASAGVIITKSETKVSLSNSHLQLDIDLATCRYHVSHPNSEHPILHDAGLTIGLSRLGRNNYKSAQNTVVNDYQVEAISNHLGRGQKATLSVTDNQTACTRIHTFEVYDSSPIVVLGFGLINNSDKHVRVYFASSVAGAELFSGTNIENPMMLNGGAGDAQTIVRKGTVHRDLNSMMLTGKVKGERKTIVAGGLTHYDFIKEVEYTRDEQKVTLSAFSWDPYGRLVNAGETYISKDKIYIDCITANPFEALEAYGMRMRAANDIKLNYYDFPTFCGWAMSMGYLGVGGNYNNSKALVDIANDAQQDGFTRFTPVAMRLEPDTYINEKGSCSQGWYDDEHFRKFKKLVPPHETFKAFADDLKKVGAIPFSYVQVNMPDPAFAKAHPDWLLAGHDKRLEQNPGKYPPYRWDCTDKEFEKHMIGVWKRWASSGLIGIKHDYPHTGWFVNGGFDDPHATCTSAYKKWFEMCREGLGPNGLIHERNLRRNRGVLSRQFMPALDTCIGINDLQRVSKDNSHIEPEFLTKIALRWYKNRVVMNYYPDCKAMTVNKTQDMDADKRHTILTMIPLISGRLELATPYSHWTPAIKHDISRVFPMLTSPKSPRPVDMLTGKPAPEVYVYDVTPAWSHVIFFNADNPRNKNNITALKRISAPISGDQADTGSLGLKAESEYYAYDFWGDKLVGKFKGTDTLSAELAPCRSAIYSVHEVKDHPQFISSNRHILQGQFELSDVQWKGKTLSGKAAMVANDPMVITVACNGREPEVVKADADNAKLLSYNSKTGLCRIELSHSENAAINWSLTF